MIAGERYVGRSRKQGQALTARPSPGDLVPPVRLHLLRAAESLKAHEDLETRGFNMGLALQHVSFPCRLVFQGSQENLPPTSACVFYGVPT